MDKKFVACMFIDNGKAVKSFTDHTIIFDDPVRLAEQYSDDDADALLLFDVSAGENHIQSLLLYKDICDVVNIPVIASGGCGKLEHFTEVFEKTNSAAALAASLFHYKELTVGQVKEEMQRHDIPVRMPYKGE